VWQWKAGHAAIKALGQGEENVKWANKQSSDKAKGSGMKSLKAVMRRLVEGFTQTIVTNWRSNAKAASLAKQIEKKKSSGMKLLSQVLKRMNLGACGALIYDLKEALREELDANAMALARQTSKSTGCRIVASVYAGILKGAQGVALQDWKFSTNAQSGSHLVKMKGRKSQHAVGAKWLKNVYYRMKLIRLHDQIQAWARKTNAFKKEDENLTKKAINQEAVSDKKKAGIKQLGMWMKRQLGGMAIGCILQWKQASDKETSDYEARLAMWASQNGLEQKAQSSMQGSALKMIRQAMGRLKAEGLRGRVTSWFQNYRGESTDRSKDIQAALAHEAEFSAKGGGLTMLKNIFKRFQVSLRKSSLIQHLI